MKILASCLQKFTVTEMPYAEWLVLPKLIKTGGPLSFGRFLNCWFKNQIKSSKQEAMEFRHIKVLGSSMF